MAEFVKDSSLLHKQTSQLHHRTKNHDTTTEEGECFSKYNYVVYPCGIPASVFCFGFNELTLFTHHITA
jgi:hypothetical protein